MNTNWRRWFAGAAVTGTLARATMTGAAVTGRTTWRCLAESLGAVG